MDRSRTKGLEFARRLPIGWGRLTVTTLAFLTLTFGCGQLGPLPIVPTPMAVAVLSDSAAIRNSVLSYTTGSIDLGLPGGHPTSIAFDAATDDAYVAFASDQTVQGPSYVDVVSCESDAVVDSIPIAQAGSDSIGGVAVDTLTGDVLVATALNEVVVISAATDSVIRNITVGSGPDSIAFDAGLDRVFVANFDSNNITVLNGSTFEAVASIATSFPTSMTVDPVTGLLDVVGLAGFTTARYVVGLNVSNYSRVWGVLPTQLAGGSGPMDSALDSANGELYVPTGSPGDGILSLDGGDGATVGETPVGSAPDAVEYSPPTNTLVVTDSGSDNVSLLNGTTLTGTSTSVGGDPEAVAFDSTADEVVVANLDSDTLSFLGGERPLVDVTLSLARAPMGLTYVPSLNALFAVGGDSLEEVQPPDRSVSANVSVGQYPQSVVLDPITDSLFVTNADDGTVSILSATNLSTELTEPVGSFPVGAAYDSATQRILVAVAGADILAVLSAENGSVLRTVRVGAYPLGLLYDASQNLIFVTNYDSANVSVISGSTLQLVTTIALPYGYSPEFPALDPSNGRIFIPEGFADNVSVVSASNLTVVQEIPSSRESFAAVYDPLTGLVYASDPSQQLLSVINASSGQLVGALPVGNVPFGVACDPTTGTLYVADQMSDNISVLTPINSNSVAVMPAWSLAFVVLGLAVGAAATVVGVTAVRRTTKS